MSKKLSSEEINKLDPYQFMAALGKKVIHPGGKKSTEELLQMAELKPEHHVLEIGCGVGTSAIDFVKRFGCNATITDIDENMLEKAKVNVTAASMNDKIKIEKADILQLLYNDNTFDVVIIEAVTMFVNRQKAISEVMRVCKPNGKVIEHEFIWRKKPTLEARKIFEGEICPGIKFDTSEDWINIYTNAGLKNTKVVTGPFCMMSVKGFLSDEGLFNTFAIMTKAMSRISFMQKMMWLMPRIMKVKNSLGYVVFAGTKA